MGTNYYLYEKPPCEECGRPYEAKHIGKSSAGWCFSLHVIPEEGINDLDDWKKLWNKEGTYIQDEYGTTFNQTIIEREIMERGVLAGSSHESERWLAENSAENGPNGLVRHRIDGKFCIGHGKGTWDLIVGEFS
jgi:hypothetical protein